MNGNFHTPARFGWMELQPAAAALKINKSAMILFSRTIASLSSRPLRFARTSGIRRFAPIIRGIRVNWLARLSNVFSKVTSTQYQRVTGRKPESDHDKALASWFWRNTHYCHGEEGAEDLWGKGFTHGGDVRGREYWTGLFAHGFGLCGTTHSQWTAEIEQLLGHGRARGVGVEGHNSFEVFLSGGSYGAGRWALLDHDVSTVIFDEAGERLLSLREVQADWERLANRKFRPEKQHGWTVCGLHPSDGTAYRAYNVAEYLPGYAGPPPIIHLRRGETLRRYFRPGLEDGKTFVFWGRNYNIAGIPGPERSLTWVNQPEKMNASPGGVPHREGQARYANAVYTYQPDFKSVDYREGVVEETDRQVTFEFYTPFIIGATPPDDSSWGIYLSGGLNGVILEGQAECQIAVSVDQGRSWRDCGRFQNRMDLTDHLKGHRQYFLRFATAASNLANSALKITTVCQANAAIFPRLKDNGTNVSFSAARRAILSAGPNIEQARTHIVAGTFDSPGVTLALRAPRKQRPLAVYAAAHLASGNPPDPGISYFIDYSTDAGKAWHAVVSDWRIPRRGDEPKDFWSQSFCYGSAELSQTGSVPVQIRFRNNGGKKILRAEAHLIYQTEEDDGTKVTFDWMDSKGPHRASHLFRADSNPSWFLNTAEQVETRWVEFATARANDR